MPSLAELLGLAPPSAPWNSSLAPPSASATPWWLPAAGLQSNPPFADPLAASPNAAPHIAPDVANGGWLGGVLAARNAARSPTSGGILQGAVPDAGEDTAPATASAPLTGAFPFGVGVIDPLTAFRLPAGSSVTPTLSSLWDGSRPWPSQGSARAPLDPWQAPIFGAPNNVGSGVVRPGRPTPTNIPGWVAFSDPSNVPDVALPAQRNLKNPASDPGSRSEPDVGSAINAEANRQSSAGETTATAQNPAPGTGGDGGNTSVPADNAPDPALALARERAKATIASDPELRNAARLAQAAGDKTYADRVAAIIANLEQDPEAARNAIWREVFAAGARLSQIPSLAAGGAYGAIVRAANRLDELHPGLGLGWALEDANEQLKEFNRDQLEAFHTILATPGLSGSERWKRFGDAGLIDAANASLADPQHLLHVLGGGLLSAGAPIIGGFGPRRSPGFSYRGGFDPETPELLEGAEAIRQARSLAGRRWEPGIVTGDGVWLDGPWLMGNREAPIPRQVADRLRGRRFSTFDGFRKAFWMTVADVPELAAEFNPQNQALMRQGNAPGTIELERLGQQRQFHMHHMEEIQNGGDVYNVDNMRVVTPLRHYEIHRGR